MLINVPRVVKICTDKKITPNHLFYCYAIHTKDFALLYKCHEEMKLPLDNFETSNIFNYHDILLPLIELEYVEPIEGLTKYSNNFRINKNDPYLWDNLKVTDKFIEELFINYKEAGEELFEVYPAFTEINGKKISNLKGGDYKSKYLGKDEMIDLYLEKINHSYHQHKENIEGVKKAIKLNHQLPIIRSYIIDELWNSFNKLESVESSERFNVI